MVNNLSDLAVFLQDQSIPAWVKDALRSQQDEIIRALDQGSSYDLRGPEGQVITIAPKKAVAAHS